MDIAVYMPDHKFVHYTVHSDLETMNKIVSKYKLKNEGGQDIQKTYITYNEHGSFQYKQEYIRMCDLDALFNELSNLNKLFYNKNSASNTQSGIFVYTEIPI